MRRLEYYTVESWAAEFVQVCEVVVCPKSPLMPYLTSPRRFVKEGVLSRFGEELVEKVGAFPSRLEELPCPVFLSDHN